MNRMDTAILAAALGLLATTAGAAGPVAPAPNGISLPAGYKDWRVIAASHRTDNKTVRVILGNDIAIAAARRGQTNPWPEGTVLAKLVWKERTDAAWPAAIVPDAFVHAEFMIKDPARYAATGGWGFARWLGTGQTPYGNDPGFVQECFACHAPVKDHDWVFTRPVVLP